MNSPDHSDRDLRFITRAVELSKRGLYTTKPNPRVGCVVVQGDEIVGEGGMSERVSPMQKSTRCLPLVIGRKEVRSLSALNRARTPDAQDPVPKLSWMLGSAESWQR